MKTAPRPVPGLAAAALLAALLGGCASVDTTSVSTEVTCVESRMVPIVVGNNVHFVRGHCKAWAVGPTPLERDRFDRRHQAQGQRP
jgi:hypothetical protein